MPCTYTRVEQESNDVDKTLGFINIMLFTSLLILPSVKLCFVLYIDVFFITVLKIEPQTSKLACNFIIA